MYEGPARDSPIFQPTGWTMQGAKGRRIHDDGGVFGNDIATLRLLNGY